MQQEPLSQSMPISNPPVSVGGAGAIARTFARINWRTVGELAVLLLWTLLFTRVYLNFDPQTVPGGREYEMSVQSQYMWELFRECGTCAFWNGFSQGGTPATVDLYGAMLHPLIVATNLLWGVVNGTKIALIGAFFMAGFAQWWLARVLGLGVVARLWSSMLVVVGGHLAGRMDMGLVGLVLSAAACALVLPPLILTMQTLRWRAAVLLGITLALAALAGQAYLQFTLIFMLPTALLLVDWQRVRLADLAQRLGLAAGLAVLLAAPFLVPFLHFFPQFAKPINPELVGIQPLGYVPLGLVIAEHEVLNSGLLGTVAIDTPYQYTSYIGWVPILLAVVGIYYTRTRAEWRTTGFLLVGMLAAFWISGGGIHRAALDYNVPVLSDLVYNARIISLGVGMAIPLLLALAALGLDRLLNADWWWQIALGARDGARQYAISTRLVLLIPLLLGLQSAWTVNRGFLQVAPRSGEMPPVLVALGDTNGIQWVNPPFGEIYWVGPSIEAGLKLSVGSRPWSLRDRVLPGPVLEADRIGIPQGANPQPIASFGNINIFSAAEREYATITSNTGERTICTATGQGGHLSVACDAPQAGVLQILENRWSGWAAQVNGQPAPILTDNQWLQVQVPAGEVQVELRYHAWDFYLGVLLMLGGLGLAGFVLVVGQPPRLPRPSAAPPAPQSTPPPPVATPPDNGENSHATVL